MNLADFDIDPNQGFLPNPDPLTKLPSLFRPSDELGKAMPSLLDDKKEIEKTIPENLAVPLWEVAHRLVR